MYIDFLTVVVTLIILFTLVLQVIATRRVRKDKSFAPDQRRVQMWLIWLVPFIGAAFVLAVLADEPSDRSKSNQHTVHRG